MSTSESRAVTMMIGHRLEAPHLLADFDPRLVGEHDIEQDEVRVHSMEQPEGFVAVAGRLDREALAGQPRGQRLAIGLLVVDHQDQGPVVPGRAGLGGPAAHGRCICDRHAVFSLRQRRGGPGAA